VVAFAHLEDFARGNLLSRFDDCSCPSAYCEELDLCLFAVLLRSGWEASEGPA
jgi:hypothetical protein